MTIMIMKTFADGKPTINIIRKDVDGDYDADDCECSQYDYESIAIEETNDDALRANDRLKGFLSDVRSRYGINTKTQRLYLSIIITLLLVITLISIFFWKYHHNIDGVAAISLYGNGRVQIGRAGFLPFHSWKCLFKRGDIDLVEGKRIVIKRPGLYHLYAQMMFFRNAVRSKRNFTVNPVMDFGVTRAKTNERLIATSVSIHSCRVACTRYVAGIVRLRSGDILTLDSATPGVYFKMVKEKAFFGAYLLIGDE